jgi:hypothetical protein
LGATSYATWARYLSLFENKGAQVTRERIARGTVVRPGRTFVATTNALTPFLAPYRDAASMAPVAAAAAPSA